MATMVTEQTCDDMSPRTTRTAMQQEYILTALGFVLHPLITQNLDQVKNPAGGHMRVAVVSDSFTTPSQEQNRMDPSFDISWQHISTEKVYSPTGLDPRLMGCFDAVAVNLIHTSIENDQWDMTVQNLANLLRPEGWIQWVDWDPITARIAGCKPGTPDASNLRDLFRNYTDALQARKVGSTYRISNSFKSQGLVEGDSDLYPVAPDVGLTHVITNGALEYLERIGEISSEEVKVTGAKIENELEVSGPLVWYDLWCHIARRPNKSLT